MDKTLQHLNQLLAEPKLHRQVREDDPLLSAVPDWWRDVLLADADDRIRLTLQAWEVYRDQLPTVCNFLAIHLRSVNLMTNKDLVTNTTSVRLLYELQIADQTAYYAGGNPLGKTMSPRVQDAWGKLPADFRHFYDSLHNGWYDLSSDSMGPSPTEHFSFLDEFEWGILDEIGDPGCDLKDLLAVYSNGMGSYVALSVGRREYGDVLWWKDKPPLLNIDAWAVIDSWTEIGLIE